jgi:transposase
LVNSDWTCDRKDPGFSRGNLCFNRSFSICVLRNRKNSIHHLCGRDCYILGTGAVVFVTEGKVGEALAAFWGWLQGSSVKIQTVVIEIPPTYIREVFEKLPTTVIAFDCFHIDKLLNEKLLDLRRSLYRKVCLDRDKTLSSVLWKAATN